jgi:hypothetical protein
MHGWHTLAEGSVDFTEPFTSYPKRFNRSRSARLARRPHWIRSASVRQHCVLSHVATRRILVPELVVLISTEPPKAARYFQAIPNGSIGALLLGHRCLVCDRDTKWSGAFRQTLANAGVRVVARATTHGDLME